MGNLFSSPPDNNEIGLKYDKINPITASNLKAFNSTIQGLQKIMCSKIGQRFYQYILNTPVSKTINVPVADLLNEYKSILKDFIEVSKVMAKEGMPIEIQNFFNNEMLEFLTVFLNNSAVNGKVDPSKAKQNILDMLVSLCPGSNAPVTSPLPSVGFLQLQKDNNNDTNMMQNDTNMMQNDTGVLNTVSYNTIPDKRTYQQLERKDTPIPQLRQPFKSVSKFGMSTNAKYGTFGGILLLIIIAVVIFVVIKKKKKKVSFGKRR